MDDDTFVRVESATMSKPVMKKGKAWSAENGVDDGETVDGHGRVFRFIIIVIIRGSPLVVLLRRLRIGGGGRR